MLRALALSLTIVGMPWGFVSADAPPDLGANAALNYWQAFAQLPKLTDAQEHKLNEEYLVMPLDSHAREIVTGADYAFRMMHRGAALPHCDWGLDIEEGIELMLPHAQAARTLSTLACLRARIRFEEGHNAEALDDLVDAMTLGRHATRDGVLLTALINIGIEQRTGDTLARYLPTLNAEVIRRLKARLGALPPAGTLAEGVGTFEQKAGLDWLIRKVKEQKDPESLAAFLGTYCGRGGDSPEQARARGRAFLEECGGTADGVVKMAEETRPCYAMGAKMLELPLDQCEKEFALEAKRRAGNPAFKTFFPPVSSLRLSQARADISRALLATALDVQLEGPDALKKHPDPVVGGPFELVAFEGGFELHSKFHKPDDGKPWVLIVGQRRGK
jgi:hypothetical protein